MTAASGTSIETMTTAEDYFVKVVKPNMDVFFQQPSNFATTVNLATSLFHLHEWLFDGFQQELESLFNSPFNSSGQFWKAVEGTNAKFGYIRDVTNASKHVKIGKFPTSTGMNHMANTHLISTSYGQGGYGEGPYGGGPDVVFNDSGTQISFDDCAKELFAYWEMLLQQLTGKFYVSVPVSGSIQV